MFILKIIFNIRVTALYVMLHLKSKLLLGCLSYNLLTMIVSLKNNLLSMQQQWNTFIDTIILTYTFFHNDLDLNLRNMGKKI